MAIRNKNKCCQGCREKGSLLPAWESKLGQALKNKKKLNRELSSDWSVDWSIYLSVSKELKSVLRRDIHIPELI